MLMLDVLEPSTTTTQVDPEITVGSTNTPYARNNLRLNNSLHDIELNRYIDLPIIAVVGSQSSGKSSLIQAISGIPLLKAPGDACTRCPIECRLTRGDGAWSCQVYLRRVIASSGTSVSDLPKEPFGGLITDKDLLEDRISRAQFAILNPSTPAGTFLEGDADPGGNELTFSPNIICLEITGPDYSEISFVDLPGLIHNVGTSGNRENIGLIKKLASSYVSKKNCIILMTITCETDFANQGAYDLARTYDPYGRRTVGVLTKPDRSPEAAHEKWVRYIRGETEPLHHGWFCVKQPDTQSPHPPPSLVEAREQEDRWFKKTSTWRELPRTFHNRLGTKKLVQHLEEILSDLMSENVPELGTQIQNLIENTNQELAQLGQRPSDDSVGEISFPSRPIDEAVKFKNELRATCPEFRAWSKDLKKPPTVKPLPELLLDGDPPPDTSVKREVIFLDDVLEKKARSSVRGLPDSGQNNVAEEYLRSFTAKWDTPTNKFVRESERHLQAFIKEAIDARCGKFSHNGLPIHLRYVRVSVLLIYDNAPCRDTIQSHLQECFIKTRSATDLLLKLEHTGHTRNERYYREYKDKFLSHLKMQRELAANNTVLRDLERLASPNGVQPTTAFTSAITSAKTALSKAGFPAIEDLAFARLLPPHPTDAALEDMAKASAGFEVALHRFVDYVPLVVDTELVRGVCQDLARVLRHSFKFNEPNLVERCREYLQEPPDVKGDREFLEQKLRRLARAEEELRNFWGP
ncbi:P-loop containing nucleoside triphosphate hydrolase protein [Lactarius akahatsu]|uniref:P-loop containing nucleoside triphosphate hydrolase protein n=1 Tax=Lactarius akahatsu TaxID=416441 RepID=A0AAD4QGB0_9AGAM|nr:P-loop containing nucleoside triphosphate hydrolase protein [Lactarius akahatsu]